MLAALLCKLPGEVEIRTSQPTWVYLEECELRAGVDALHANFGDALLMLVLLPEEGLFDFLLGGFGCILAIAFMSAIAVATMIAVGLEVLVAGFHLLAEAGEGLHGSC